MLGMHSARRGSEGVACFEGASASRARASALPQLSQARLAQSHKLRSRHLKCHSGRRLKLAHWGRRVRDSKFSCPPAVQPRLQALLAGRKEGEAARGAARHNGDLGDGVVLGHQRAHLHRAARSRRAGGGPTESLPMKRACWRLAGQREARAARRRPGFCARAGILPAPREPTGPPGQRTRQAQDFAGPQTARPPTPRASAPARPPACPPTSACPASW